MKMVLTIKQKVFIHILLSVYTFALIRPIIPVVADVVAHTFFKVQHMATVHYENGKFHVHKELQKASEKTDPVAHGNIIVEALSFHLQTENIIIPVNTSLNTSKTYFTYINFPVDICLTSPTPPPKA